MQELLDTIFCSGQPCLLKTLCNTRKDLFLSSPFVTGLAFLLECNGIFSRVASETRPNETVGGAKL